MTAAAESMTTVSLPEILSQTYDYDSTRIHVTAQSQVHDTAQFQVHDTAQSRSQYWTGRYRRNNRMAGWTIMTTDFHNTSI